MTISLDHVNQNHDLLLFNNSFNKELNIYNHSELIKVSTLSNITDFPSNNNYLGLMFNINGELTGKIICILNLTKEQKNQSQLIQLKSIFTESMNILLGNFLTNLESSSSIMSVVSAPKLIESNNIRNSFPAKNSNSKYHFVVQYIMHSLKEKYLCDIYFYANPKNIKEV